MHEVLPENKSSHWDGSVLQLLLKRELMRCDAETKPCDQFVKMVSEPTARLLFAVKAACLTFSQQ